MSNTLESVKQNCLDKLAAAISSDQPKLGSDLANIYSTLEYASRPPMTYNSLASPVLETVTPKTKEQIVAIEGT